MNEFFVFKLVNHLGHCESLDIRKNSEIDEIFLWWQRFVDFQTNFKVSLIFVLRWNYWIYKHLPTESLMFWQFFYYLQNCILDFLNETVSFWTCVHYPAKFQCFTISWIGWTLLIDYNLVEKLSQYVKKSFL